MNENVALLRRYCKGQKIEILAEQNMISAINFICRYQNYKKDSLSSRMGQVVHDSFNVAEILMINNDFKKVQDLNCFYDLPNNDKKAIAYPKITSPDLFYKLEDYIKNSNIEIPFESIPELAMLNYVQTFVDFLSGKQQNIVFRDIREAKIDFMENNEQDILKALFLQNRYPKSNISFCPCGDNFDSYSFVMITDDESRQYQHLNRIK